MRSVSPTQRRFIEMQGFVGHDDAALAEIAPWLRLSPAICMTWTAVATAIGSAAMLYALVPFAIAGAVLNGHPFDALYNHGIRHLLGTRALPRYGAPRRFACAVASVWLIVAATALATGWTTVGLALGGSMAVAASVPTFTGFCIPSFVYQRLFGTVSDRAAAV